MLTLGTSDGRCFRVLRCVFAGFYHTSSSLFSRSFHKCTYIEYMQVYMYIYTCVNMYAPFFINKQERAVTPPPNNQEVRYNAHTSLSKVDAEESWGK